MTRETVFKEVGGVVGGLRLSLSLFPPFFPTACSLFFRSSAPVTESLAGLIQEPGYGLLSDVRTSFAVAPAVTFGSRFARVSHSF